MMRRLMEAFGVDYAQWKVMTALAFRLANREQVIYSTSHSKNLNHSLWMMIAMYGFLGLMQCIFVIRISDPFWTSFVVFSFLVIMIGSLIMFEFGTRVVAPEDYQIFSVQPVSSKTYFASKTAFVLIIVIFTTAVFGLPTILLMSSVKYLRINRIDLDPALFFCGTVALFMTAIFITMVIILLYTSVLRFIHFRKLKNILSYVQLIFSFGIFGGYALLPGLLEKLSRALPSQKPWWVFLIPTSWFSAIVDIGAGNLNYQTVIPAIGVVFIFIVLIPRALSKISLQYSENLSKAISIPEAINRSTQNSGEHSSMFVMKVPEDRVITRLILCQFKNDTRFRLTILAIIPLTVLYILMGLQNSGGSFNPFHPHWKGGGNSFLLYVALIIFPWMLKEAVTQSETYQAAWIFFATPSDRISLILSLKKTLVRFFILPYLFLLGVFLSGNSILFFR